MFLSISLESLRHDRRHVGSRGWLSLWGEGQNMSIPGFWQYKRNISFLTQMKRKIFAIDSCVRFEDAMEN